MGRGRRAHGAHPAHCYGSLDPAGLGVGAAVRAGGSLGFFEAGLEMENADNQQLHPSPVTETAAAFHPQARAGTHGRPALLESLAPPGIRGTLFFSG